MSDNGDFQFQPTWAEIIAALDLPDETAQWQQQIVEVFTRRDHELEDFVNECVRRTAVFNGVGDGTAHTGTAWQNTVPVMSVPFTKARTRTRLNVAVSTRGRFDNAAGGWVEFGVQVRRPDGTVVEGDTPVVRARFQGVQDGTNQNAVGFVRVDAPDGPLVVRLRLRTDHATATAWVSDANCTCSMQVTESR